MTDQERTKGREEAAELHTELNATDRRLGTLDGQIAKFKKYGPEYIAKFCAERAELEASRKVLVTRLRALRKAVAPTQTERRADIERQAGLAKTLNNLITHAITGKPVK